jgi:hypothetical protein
MRETGMTRVQGWEGLFGCYVQTFAGARFAYGTHDCTMFVCDGVRVMTGVDLADGFRGKYSSAAGALKVIRKYVGTPQATLEQLAEAIAAKHGIAEVPVLMAQRGDVLLLSTPDGPALGLLSLDGWHVLAAAPKGLTRTPLQDCLRAWRTS